ncbi:MAG: hypothetical protein NT157_05000 [Candidatus Micrarchaeota archaeon]|nr:hypothetical protein [Candidatus Micrarchaeota archaeon]
MAMPEAELINSELLVRDMQLTDDVKMTRKSLLRWVALSTGLISPNESRDTAIILLEALLHFSFMGKEPEVPEIMEYMQAAGAKTGEKTVRYHLLQLKKRKIIENDGGKYRFVVPSNTGSRDAGDSFEYSYKSQADSAFAKIKEAVRRLKEMGV